MFKTFSTMLLIFWLFDVMNLPFMAIFDTTYAVNGWAWFLTMLILMFSSVPINTEEKRHDK